MTTIYLSEYIIDILETTTGATTMHLLLLPSFKTPRNARQSKNPIALFVIR